MNRATQSESKKADVKLLIEILEDIHHHYDNNPRVCDIVEELVRGFIHNPFIANGSMLNMMIMGTPGVGKSFLGEKFARLLGGVGLLIYDTHVKVARHDFVAEYEGQTAVKTRALLENHVESTVFLDEAYALTDYNEKDNDPKKRKLGTYAAEAIATLVDFTSDFAGRACLITAGYQKQMENDFLPANEGLDRRFSYKVLLEDYKPKKLRNIFIEKLVETRWPKNAEVPQGDASLDYNQKIEKVKNFFTAPGYAFLLELFGQGMERSTPPLWRVNTKSAPKFEILNGLISKQGGACLNLASTTAKMMASSEAFKDGEGTMKLGPIDVYDIFENQLYTSSTALTREAIERELDKVSLAIGWKDVDGNWLHPYNNTGLKRGIDAIDDKATPADRGWGIPYRKLN